MKTKDESFEKMSAFGEDLLVKAKKVFDEAEVLTETGTRIQVQFDSGKLTNIEQLSDTDLSLRVINESKLGITGTTKPSGADELLAEAKVSSQYGEKATFSFPKTTKTVKEVKTFSDSVADTSIEKIISDAQGAVEKLAQNSPGFIPRFLIATWSWDQTRLINTAGTDLVKSGTHVDKGIDASRIVEGDFFEVAEMGEGRKWEKSFTELADILGEKIRWGKRIVPLGSGPFTVVFPPKTVETLLEYFGLAVNGREVNDKSSRFAGKLGQTLFDPRINLINSAIEDFRPNSEPFDDEGVPTGKMSLVAKGILRNFIYDLGEAGRAKVKSTGSGTRHSVFLKPGPAVNNLIFAGGTKPWQKILSGIKKGILANAFVGHGQGNIHNGDFSLGLELGYLIDNGEIVGRVKGAGLAGNVFDLLKDNLMELSQETEWNGNINAPYIVLSGVSVTPKT